MMLKPKTPFSLPKSAMAKLDSINPIPSNKISDKVMMTSNEPAVIIQKPANNSKKANEKKNQGPTRDEVFGKIDSILAKLAENESTNEAFTSWKEAGIPDKMVNNALIHLFKQVIKLTPEEKRALCYQVVDQLFSSELVTPVQVKESLARLVDRMEESSTSETAELAAWTVATDKLKLAEVAEMTEGGASHPLFLSILQSLATKDEASTLSKFRTSGVKLTDQLPLALRTEEQLGVQLEERNLSFLVPLLAIKADMGRQLEGDNTKPSAFLAWVTKNVPEESQKDPGFITALLGAVVKHISEATTLAGEGSQDKEATDKEKEMILSYKDVLQPFLSTPELQLIAVYSLQVFCFSRGFPKGLLLRWFVSLYEADIVDEHVFLQWKEDVNDSYPGKGKALFQVNNWLTWLEEAESEDDEDEDD
jgi:translation initiation factor 4G